MDTPTRILVVEDERIVALDIRSRLQKLGYEVVGIASTGTDAVAAAAEQQPDLVLMDVVLRGEVDGIDAAQQIRDDTGIPVVFLTAFADERTLGRAKLTEPFGYVLKPFEERELRIAVEMAVYKHRMQDKLHAEEVRYRGVMEQLRQSRENLRAVIENTSEAIWSVDAELKLLTCNATFRRLFKTSYGVAIEPGMRIPDHLPPGMAERWTGRFRRALAGEPFSVEENYVVGGEPMTFQISYNPIRSDGDEGATGVAVFARDVTMQKQVEQTLREAKQRAEEASRLKDAILANMSHEIRTPMTAILGFSELLSRRLKDSDLAPQAEMIHNGGKRLLELLNNIIDLARIEANKLQLAPTPHPISESVQSVVNLLGILAERKGLAIRTYVDTSLIVATDPNREQQVLTNIIGNAIRFTNEGTITITASREANSPYGIDAVVIRVADTGVGISADFLPHVFEEFRQESEGLAREFEGSGLGLPIAKKLVERMGGTIEIESTKGIGTTVTIVLPNAVRADLPAGGTEAAAGSEPDSAAPAPLHVLVVEDDPSCSELVAETLQPNHRVVVAESGEEGLAAAAGEDFDVVFMDIHFRQGRMDGIEALEALRELPGYAERPVVAVTAYAMKGDEERFLDAGFSAYLAKPFTAEELLALLKPGGA